MTESEYKAIAGWIRHIRRTAEDDNLSRQTRRKIYYRIRLLEKLVQIAKHEDEREYD